MVNYRLVAVAGLCATVYSLPLNINLGAYSPALVVGDGEITFRGNQDVSNLMSTLEGAAINAAAGTTAGTAGTTGTTGAQVGQPAAAPAAPAAENKPSAAVAQPAAPATAATPSTAAAPTATPAVVGEGVVIAGANQDKPTQIQPLQGMGKEIAPRLPEQPTITEAPMKRDLASFDRALKFAEAALTKGPKVQLGTGEGGSGAGILVDNNQAAAARAGTGAAAGAAAAKRDESAISQPRMRAKITTMYVRRGLPAGALKASPEIVAREIEPMAVSGSTNIIKRDTGSSSAIDSVNLNVDGDQGVTMTFIETAEDNAEDDE